MVWEQHLAEAPQIWKRSYMIFTDNCNSRHLQAKVLLLNLAATETEVFAEKDNRRREHEVLLGLLGAILAKPWINISDNCGLVVESQIAKQVS